MAVLGDGKNKNQGRGFQKPPQGGMEWLSLPASGTRGLLACVGREWLGTERHAGCRGGNDSSAPLRHSLALGFLPGAPGMEAVHHD